MSKLTKIIHKSVTVLGLWAAIEASSVLVGGVMIIKGRQYQNEAIEKAEQVGTKAFPLYMIGEKHIAIGEKIIDFGTTIGPISNSLALYYFLSEN